MTLRDVQSAATALAAAGTTPSGNTVLAYIKARGMQGSKRTILKLLKQLDPVPVVRPTPGAADPAPVPLTVAEDDPVYHASPVVSDLEPAAPADPVQMAESRLRVAEQDLLDARDGLLHAKTVLIATKNLAVENVLHGTLHMHDEVHYQALADVDDAKRLYDAAWQRRGDALQTLATAEKTYCRKHQESWVEQHQPELVQNLHFWEEKLRTATSDWAHAEAKKNAQIVRHNYERAVVQAPVGLNHR